MNWDNCIDELLEKIRLNCIILSNLHTKNHLYYKGCSLYFEIPTIILSVFSGSFSVGAGIFMNQEHISIITSSISMIITILTSIKLYMKINENSSTEQSLAISFKSLALDIYKIISLSYDNRGIDGLIYLNKIYSKYINLVENSNLLSKINNKDNLLKINVNQISSDSSGSSISSNPLEIQTEEHQL